MLIEFIRVIIILSNFSYRSQVVEIDEFDITGWWLEHIKYFPTLCKLYLRISCTPGSACTSERVFSGSANTITFKRNCLLPENVNSITLVNNIYNRNQV